MDFLIVEDDPVMQALAGAMLRRLGFGFRFAEDGEGAIASCQQHPPGAVLMDVQMPRMDGLAATRALRRLQRSGELPPFPIIVVSGYYSPADRAACFEAGADGFVTKPLMLAKLGAEIFRVVKRQPGERPPTLSAWDREVVPEPRHRAAR